MVSNIVLAPKIQIGYMGLYRVGFTRNTGGTSDFTASGVTQTTTITFAKPGDIILTDEIGIEVITPVVHAATFTARLGITGTIGRFLGSAAAIDVKDATARWLVPSAASEILPYVNNTASDVAVILTLVAGSGNVSDATAGELQIRIPIIRKVDRVDFMEA